MTRVSTTLAGRHVTLNIGEGYKDELDRSARAFNIATFLRDNWEILCGIGDKITYKKVRDLMIEGIGKLVRNTKGELLSTLPPRSHNASVELREVRAGDDRAHGDAMGKHCLMLSTCTIIIGELRNKAIYLNGENKAKIETYLKRSSQERVSCIH